MRSTAAQSSVYRTKLSRIRRGGVPRVMDLFAGCGGLSLGFHAAGFSIAASVEIDALATCSHANNFYRNSSERLRERHAKPRDITTDEPETLLDELGVKDSVENAIDVVIGGPPCQAFARVGRAKLREIDEHPEAFLQDARGNLYLRYLHYVRLLKPIALVMENVPDVLNYGGHNIAEEMCEVLEAAGYVCSYTLLNSAFYGVPQMRERMFLIAYWRGVTNRIVFPKPTNWVTLPPGYQGSRHVALQVLKKNGYDFHKLPIKNQADDKHFYQPPPVAASTLPPAITTEQALRDLPPITDHLKGLMRRGARRFTDFVVYRPDVAPTGYGQLMRSWRGFQSEGGVFDHVIRSLPRDYQLFRRMKPGDQYPQAYKLALKICEEERLRRRISKGSQEHQELTTSIVPPYDPGKFPNKWRKLEAFLPSRTLLAHIGKDTYSHIHYDSKQARTISVREAARLQSFPDGFTFAGTMNPAFRQIGNAVPPLMSQSIAETMMRTILRQPPQTSK